MNKKIKTLKPANITNLNKYLKQFTPNIKPVDVRKYPFKYLRPEYIEQLKKDQLETVNKLIDVENNKIIRQYERETKILNKLVREVNKKAKEQKATSQIQEDIELKRRNNNIALIKNYIEELRPELVMLQDGKNNHKLEINHITVDEDYERLYYGMLFSTIGNYDNFKNINTKWVLTIDDNYYGINQKSIQALIDAFNGKVYSYNDTSSNEIIIIRAIKRGDPIVIESSLRTNKNRNQLGAFFKYYLNKPLNLIRYQITNNNNNDDINNENCLIYAFRLLGMTDDKLALVRTFLIDTGNSMIPKSKLNELSKKINITIHLYFTRLTANSNDKRRIEKFNNGNDIYKICLIDGHYFIYDDRTNYTSYFIDNYDTIKHLNNARLIYNNRNDKDENRCINSFDLVFKLLENKHQFLTPITFNNINANDKNYMTHQSLLKNVSYNTLNFDYNSYIETNSKHIKRIKNDIKNAASKYETTVKTNIYFDVETYNENKHIPYLICYSYETNNKIHNSIGINCIKDFLNDIYINNATMTEKSQITLIAHNAKYDMRFLMNYLYNCSEITNGMNFITFKGDYKFNSELYEDYKTIEIIIKDSYKIIPTKLSKFPDMFFDTDETVKEIMPYDFYNKTNLNIKYHKLEDFIKKVEDREAVLNNCKKWGCIDNSGFVDIIEYSKRYCEIDVYILKKGYIIFKEWIKRDFKLDVDNYLTISSIANAVLVQGDEIVDSHNKIIDIENVFEGVYSFSGLPREFIYNSVKGGRTMTAENKKLHIKNKKIADFDGVSLYPSAMSRLEGYVKDIPKIIKEDSLSYDIIKNYDFYVVEVEITHIGIYRKFPLMSIIDENGSRNYTNEMVNKRVILNKVELEDIIQFQKARFNIIKGYYWDSGFNTRIKDKIQYLFNKRLELKKAENKAQEIYKLILNSCYGKTIEKPHDKTVKFFNNKDELNSYLDRHDNELLTAHKYNDELDKYRGEFITDTSGHYNEPHIGGYILAMSKRIMNEVICTAEDLNLNVYYTDTDSIHIDEDQIPILENEYKKRFKRELVGKNLGQFHTDFNDKFIINGNEIKMYDVYSQEFIALGKKAYIDVLVGTDKTGVKYENYHIRMKGVSGKAINYYADKNDINVLEIYKQLYNGEEVEFDLTAGGNVPCFEFNKNYEIKTKTEFNRRVKF
jgi:hypothetical protein